MIDAEDNYDNLNNSLLRCTNAHFELEEASQSKQPILILSSGRFEKRTQFLTRNYLGETSVIENLWHANEIQSLSNDGKSIPTVDFLPDPEYSVLQLDSKAEFSTKFSSERKNDEKDCRSDYK